MTRATYDFIIVGAGSAGCLLANRLSASGKYRVALLEAGGSDRSPLISTPIGYGLTFYSPQYNWMYETRPEAALGKRALYWPRGKVLGGSSSINAMVYIRGLPSDYDRWEAQGNPGWGWDDVLPYFKRSENHVHGESAFHGAGGEFYVGDVRANIHPLCQHFFAAGAALGLPFNRDFNGPQAEGLGVWQVNIRDGKRVSSASAFLRPAMQRSNLRLYTHALSSRILFAGRRATGVEFIRDGQRCQLHAHREVILAAGAINSPQLLQLSGVGSAERLAPLGIDSVLDLPAVGRNLQDHLCNTHYYRCSVPTLNNQLYPWVGKLRAGLNYVLRKKGPLSMSVNHAGGFVRSQDALPEPNLQLYFNPITYPLAHQPGKKTLGPDPYPAFSMSYAPCRPSSRGELFIRSPDASVKPDIQPNYLSTEKDVREVIEGARFLRKLSQTSALSGIITEETLPGASVCSDDAYLEDVRMRASTVYHPCGTCSMGGDTTTSVVDHRLKIHGLEGVRVIDASVFPAIPSGNTNAPTIMVAEKGAAMVLQDHAALP